MTKLLLIKQTQLYLGGYYHYTYLFDLYSPLFNRPGIHSRGCSTNIFKINRLSQLFPPYLQNIINHTLEEQGSWYFVWMLTPHNMSQVTCHMSCVTTLKIKCWHLTPDTWHMIPDTLHVICDTWLGVNIHPKSQLPSSYGLG